VGEDVLGRRAAEAHVQVMRRQQLEARPTLHLERRRGRLVQFGGGRGQLAELHRRVARLEEDLAQAGGVLLVAVEDVLEVETGDGRHEQVARLGAMHQAPDAVVAGAMVAGGGVVADDGGDVADAEGVVHVGFPRML
jgi:hypothetical protein